MGTIILLADANLLDGESLLPFIVLVMGDMIFLAMTSLTDSLFLLGCTILLGHWATFPCNTKMLFSVYYTVYNSRVLYKGVSLELQHCSCRCIEASGESSDIFLRDCNLL